ncbi:hypothetical protein, partial [Brevibacterium casei]|uniref:hypothetical protein n=1 Tax=Brevibacterium casei TaxID=33889 RepID=UPI001C92FB47
LMTTHLSVRSFKTMLTRAGVDTDGLSFTRHDRSGQHDAGIYAGRYVEKVDIEVSGPKSARGPVRTALFDRGLECAPYPDRDFFSRGDFPQ